MNLIKFYFKQLNICLILSTNIDNIIVRLKNFYRTNIKEKMFDYELLK